jgi:hypothetical protein
LWKIAPTRATTRARKAGGQEESAMKLTTATLLAVVVSTAIMPAFAAWDRIGSLNVAAGKVQEFNMENFKGNVIGLTARESDVMCDRVTAVFANGDTRPIFKGKLPKGLSTRVDLPPGSVESLSFDCHPVMGGQGTVDLAADSGTSGTTEKHG